MISYSPRSPASPTKAREVMRVVVRPRPASARRALTHLGLSDPKDNLKVADELLAIASHHFAKKWSVDPVHFTPVTQPGRCHWVTAPDIAAAVTFHDPTDSPKAKRDLGDLCSAGGQPTVAVVTSPRRSAQHRSGKEAVTPRTKQSKITG